MKRMTSLITAVALLTAGQAFAIAKGDKLFIKSKGVKLLKDAKAGAAAVGAELKVGAAVEWQEAGKDKAFQKVKIDGKEGFVLTTNLSKNAPAAEVMEGGKSVDAQAFASSGAATKALTPAGVKYAKESAAEEKDGLKSDAAAAQLIYVEEHNKNKGTPEAIAAKAKELGGGK